MFRSLLHLPSGILSSVIFPSLILFAAASTANAGHLPQEPAAPPAQAAPGPKNPVKPTAESQAKAKKTYGFDCALCHGASGDGKTDLAKDMQLTMKDLTDPKSLAGMSDSDLFDLIRKGKDKMPPEEAARAKDDDVWQLVIYVRSLAKGGSASTSASN
ncbi:c-type cytochrome [Acidicapsa acidisoli]|uniref:c-type cytochrome n=1 Tax=Acidicapsa acidisoli TaxID=1615681 RepID=UPI0021DF497A|nr:cytochrome c [Acidicapsa acidisoli]